MSISNLKDLTAMTADQAWLTAMRDVYVYGHVCRPRGQETREILGHSFTFDMKYPVVTVPDRDLGYKFMAAEAWWILSGDNRVETIAPYSKVISSFSDDGETYFGAYGPKIVDQLNYVKDCLFQDTCTRQAVINIWRENPPPSKDIPCTLSAQFLTRNNELNCIVSMRSSDLWLGVPYDVFNFSMLSEMIRLSLLDRYPYLRLGRMVHTAGSRHLYMRDFDGANAVVGKFNQTMASIREQKLNQHLYKTSEELLGLLEHAKDEFHGAKLLLEDVS